MHKGTLLKFHGHPMKWMLYWNVPAFSQTRTRLLPTLQLEQKRWSFQHLQQVI